MSGENTVHHFYCQADLSLRTFSLKINVYIFRNLSSVAIIKNFVYRPNVSVEFKDGISHYILTLAI